MAYAEAAISSRYHDNSQRSLLQGIQYSSCIFSGKVLFRYHIRKDCGKLSNYEGNSKSMEGEGILQICNQIKAIQKSKVKYVHDNDGSTRVIITKFWPDEVELLDINHAQINICKRIVAENFPELKLTQQNIFH